MFLKLRYDVYLNILWNLCFVYDIYIQFIENNEADAAQILNDYIHVLENHDIKKINEMLNEQEYQCECKEYDGPTRRAQRQERILNDEYLIRLVGIIHGYLYHNHAQQMFDEEKKDDENDDIEDLLYGFGSFIYYNVLTSPRHSSFKDEMSNHIEITQWNALYEEAKKLMTSDFAKKYIAIKNHNNDLRVQPIGIGDILAIKFYTDFDELQRTFRKSFRKRHDTDTDKDIIDRHVSEYYFWGKWLNHAISVYGKKINNAKNITYYHGLSEKFVFSSLIQDFNLPTSVTTSLIVAQGFAKKDGIILEMKCKYDYKSEWNLSSALSVRWISSRPAEEEVLLFGNFNQMIISNIRIVSSIGDGTKEKRNKHLIQTMNNFEQLMNGYYFDNYSLEEYNNKSIAKSMRFLIKSELNGTFRDKYLGKIFHKICLNRESFVVGPFIQYQRDWSEILKFDEDQDFILCVEDLRCNNVECMKSMRKIKDGDKVPKCVQCRAVSSICCSDAEKPWEYRLCWKCANVVGLLQKLMSNAIHRFKPIPHYNDIKLNALRVESLQKKKLF